MMPSQSVPMIAVPVAAPSTLARRSRDRRVRETSVWIVQPVSVPARIHSSVLRSELSGYFGSPKAANGTRNVSARATRQNASWRGFPYSASHTTGSITSGTKPEDGPSEACRSSATTGK